MINDFIYNIKKELNNHIGEFEPIVIPTIIEYLNKNYDNINIDTSSNDSLEINVDDYNILLVIKRQDVNKTYSFPNMLSIKKAKDMLSDNKKFLIYIFIEYESFEDEIDSRFSKHKIEKIRVQRIETLNWDYLYIQNIGRGQLQIKNISKEEFVFNNDVTREEWLKILKEKGCKYYDNLMLKVVEYKTEWEKDESLDC